MIEFTQLEIKKLKQKRKLLLVSKSAFSGWDMGIIQSKINTLQKLISDYKKHQKI
jgi:hypothetical protein